MDIIQKLYTNLAVRMSWFRSMLGAPEVMMGLLAAALLSALVPGYGADAVIGASGQGTRTHVGEGATTKASNGGGLGVDVTVYNSDLALVRDTREVEIQPGVSEFAFTDIASQIDASSVSFKSLTSPGGVSVREQNYEFDIVDDKRLLEKFIGQRIRVTMKDGRVYEGYLMSGASNVVLSSDPKGDGEVTVVRLPEVMTIEYPKLPSGLVTRPTLVWMLDNASGERKHRVQVSYLTGGMSWRADYVATIGANDDRMDLVGWVTLDNKSGATYENARLKLIAGDVHRVRKFMAQEAGAEPQARVLMLKEPQFEEKEFFEYHLYTLAHPTTIKDRQTKQIELLSAQDIPVRKKFVYDGARNGNKVNVTVEFKNSKENNLGIPLPKGRVRVNKADDDGSLEFIGEDEIDHTPKDEDVRVYLGDAFDVVGSRKQTDSKNIGLYEREETYSIELRNHKDAPVEVTVVEHFYGWVNWEIVKANHKYTKKDSTTLEFAVNVPANGKYEVQYTVRYKVG